MTGAENSEIWKDIIGYERLYQISNLGNVRSVERTVNGRFWYGKQHIQVFCEKILIPQKRGKYFKVTLSKDNKANQQSIHRLVAISFLGDFTEKKLEVNHIDGDKYNNKLSNLEWVTRSENHKHAFRHGLRRVNKGEDCSWSKLNSITVLEIRKMLCESSHKEVSKKFNVNLTTIYNIGDRRSWKHI